MNTEFFINSRYKVLYCMASCQIQVNGMKIVPLTQQQIANEVGLSKKKVNSIVAELKAEGYIVQQNQTRGKYILTPAAESILAYIEETEVQ